MEPSPTFLHNWIRDRIGRRLSEFVERCNLGEVIVEMDFRLTPDTVRNPDAAWVTTEHLGRIDVNRSPVEGAPALAVEVISPTNSAEDILKKTQQYLRAGCRSVSIVYPTLRLIAVHSAAGIRKLEEQDVLKEDFLPGFSLPLKSIFETKQ